MSELVSLLRNSGEEVRVVLESTGSCHCPVVAALLENGIFVSIVNSLRMKRFCSQSIRKVKADRIDAMQIALYGLAYWQELQPTRLPEYSLVREIPCIHASGMTLAPRLIAEIGDVRRFHSKRDLIAYAGIDAPPYQSGKFCANNRHISKRGNRYLRKTGYEVMQSYVMHKPANDPIFTFIEKKRSEGKCGKLAMALSGKSPLVRCFRTFFRCHGVDPLLPSTNTPTSSPRPKAAKYPDNCSGVILGRENKNAHWSE